jgi:tRNA(Arg) A34 adenosine deaminase TadA
MVDAPVPDDVQWMQEALAEAREAGRRGEVPVGAVVVVALVRLAIAQVLLT